MAAGKSAVRGSCGEFKIKTLKCCRAQICNRADCRGAKLLAMTRETDHSQTRNIKTVSSEEIKNPQKLLKTTI